MAEIAFRVGPTVKWISGINEQTTCKVGSFLYSKDGFSTDNEQTGRQYTDRQTTNTQMDFQQTTIKEQTTCKVGSFLFCKDGFSSFSFWG